MVSTKKKQKMVEASMKVEEEKGEKKETKTTSKQKQESDGEDSQLKQQLRSNVSPSLFLTLAEAILTALQKKAASLTINTTTENPLASTCTSQASTILSFASFTKQCQNNSQP